jgi:ADP-heptose:LPS heptosyltransferase
MISKLRILFFALYRRLFGSRAGSSKRILIVRPDAIGDFLYLVHHLNSLATPDDSEIYYLGNIQNLDLTNLLLNKNIKFLPLDREKLYHDYKYFTSLSKELSDLKFNQVFYASGSRELYIDCLIYSLAVKQTHAFFGDLSLTKPVSRIITSLFYHQIFKNFSNHEHINLQRSFEQLFKNRYQLKKFTFKGEQSNFEFMKDGYIVFFPGASIKGKQWPLEKFLQLSLEFENKYKIIWLGGKLEKSLIPLIKQQRQNDIILMGETNLRDSFSIIAHAKLLVSNDTSAVHMAEISDVPSFCFLGGGHFDRFLPYPNTFAWVSQIKCFSFKMNCFNCNWNCPYVNGEENTFPCIDKISFASVKTEITKFL